MSKQKNKKRTIQNPSNIQQEMANQQVTNNIMNSGSAQPHSVKQVGFGINTRRKG